MVGRVIGVVQELQPLQQRFGGTVLVVGVQLVSITHDFKFETPDGKKRAADALDNECVQILAKHYPNNRANAFLDW